MGEMKVGLTSRRSFSAHFQLIDGLIQNIGQDPTTEGVVDLGLSFELDNQWQVQPATRGERGFLLRLQFTR